MQIKEAWAKSTIQVTFGSDGNYFREVYWKSADSGSSDKRILVTICGDQAIEIGWDGAFRSAYPAITENYYPIEIKKKAARLKHKMLIIQDLLKESGRVMGLELGD